MSNWEVAKPCKAYSAFAAAAGPASACYRRCRKHRRRCPSQDLKPFTMRVEMCLEDLTAAAVSYPSPPHTSGCIRYMLIRADSDACKPGLPKPLASTHRKYLGKGKAVLMHSADWIPQRHRRGCSQSQHGSVKIFHKLSSADGGDPIWPCPFEPLLSIMQLKYAQIKRKTQPGWKQRTLAYSTAQPRAVSDRQSLNNMRQRESPDKSSTTTQPRCVHERARQFHGCRNVLAAQSSKL